MHDLGAQAALTRTKTTACWLTAAPVCAKVILHVNGLSFRRRRADERSRVVATESEARSRSPQRLGERHPRARPGENAEVGYGAFAHGTALETPATSA